MLLLRAHVASRNSIEAIEFGSNNKLILKTVHITKGAIKVV